MSRVFIIDDDGTDITAFHDALKNTGSEVFFTGNAYKFIRYAQELTPDLYIINTDMENTDSHAVIEYMMSQNFSHRAPIVAVSNKLNIISDGISHYLKRSEIATLLPEITNSYCKGGQYYDVLLVEKDFSSPLSMSECRNLSCFKVNDSVAAQLFLGKNHTKLVAIHCPKSQYKQLKQQLKNDNAIYVENVAYLNNLVSFIK